MRWMKVRAAMDQFIKQQCNDSVDGEYRNFYASDQYTIQPFPHIQCPELNCVCFHKNGVAWEFPGNIEFRALLDEHLPSYTTSSNSSSGNLKSTRTLDSIFAPFENEGLFDRIIRLSIARNFRFLLYDETKHWYIDLKEPEVLRRYIGFAIRGRKRRESAQRQRHAISSNGIPTPIFTNMDGSSDIVNDCCNLK